MNRENASLTMRQLVSVVTLLAAVVLPSRSAAQRYAVTQLPGLGGSMSLPESINDRSWVSGGSNLSGDQNSHASLWVAGRVTDLGTLGGPDSGIGSPIHNEFGELAGLSNTSDIDPLGEDFCGFGTPYLCRGFVWLDGKMTSLPTLGGNNSYGTSANNWGEAVGFAETTVHDPNCVAPQVLDFEGVIWGPHPNEIRVLPPFRGDTISAGLAINDLGQVAGGSGHCGPNSFSDSNHAVLWQNGSVINLGSLGGLFNNLALDMNELGEVVGLSDLPGDTTNHGFLWKNGHMIDLGTLPGDNLSYAFGINNRGQVVGQSCDPSGNCRAFLWQNGVMTDLNTLIPPGSSLYLIIAISINDRGEIVGQAFDQNTGNLPGYLATPTHGHGANKVSQKLVLPPSVREMLRQQRVRGFRVRPVMPR
jgi:probable HAF family extracellular repeat protein